MELDQSSVLAGALGASNSPGPKAESARGLLTTILGEFVLPAGGAVWTQTLIAALNLLDVKEKAARQTIARMHQQGWLDRQRSGRQTRWRLTAATSELLERGADRIYGFGQDTQAWHGQWVVLMASVPEADRGARYRMHLGLRWAGFGSLGQGVWLSPWTNQEDAAVRVLADLEIAATSFVANLGQLGDGQELAAQAWDLPALRLGYESFLGEAESLVGGTHSEEHSVLELTRLVHRWRQFPFVDPDLPLELLPDDWPGPAAAKEFSAMRQRLLEPAEAWWAATEHSFASGS